MLTIFVLLVIYQLKHFLADYPLQTPYMLGKFKDTGWVKPLAAHAGVHALATFSIVLVAHAAIASEVNIPLAVALAAFDFVVHFTMDRVKASPKLMGRWKPLTAKEYAKTKGWLKDFEDFASSDAYRQETIVKERAESEARLRGNTLFWWALGIDQGVHHLTHYAIIAALLLS